MLEYGLVRFLPSVVAAASVFLAQHTLGRQPWTPTLEHYTGYVASDLEECVRALHAAHAASRAPTALPAIREKFNLGKFGAVAALAPAQHESLSPALFGKGPQALVPELGAAGAGPGP